MNSEDDRRIEFAERDEFKKELKRLSKKYPSLGEDLKVLKKVITRNPMGDGTKHWNKLASDNRDSQILKVRMMCRYIKGSQFRVIYFYDGKNFEASFIEIYFKGNKENEDANRIKSLIKSLTEEGRWIIE